jgi:hypothetical protein
VKELRVVGKLETWDLVIEIPDDLFQEEKIGSDSVYEESLSLKVFQSVLERIPSTVEDADGLVTVQPVLVGGQVGSRVSPGKKEKIWV